MKYKALLLIIALLLVLPLTISAQEDQASPDLAGDYTYTGKYGDENYEGTMTISGSAPFYMLSYSDETESGEIFEETVQALAHGNTLVSVLDGESCSPGVLVHRSDGVLVGTWIDTFTETAAPLGIEVYTPQGETAGFAGIYDLVGIYATGEMYTATVEIVENEQGWLDMKWSYESDEAFPEDIPFEELGIGMVNDNMLGYSFVDAEEINCGVFVAKFSKGSYEAVWVDTDQIPGTEAGSLAE